jgi:hypothetical protein
MTARRRNRRKDAEKAQPTRRGRLWQARRFCISISPLTFPALRLTLTMGKYVWLAFLIASSVAAADTGLLSVQSDQAGLTVYLGNDSIGCTPIVNHPVEPGDYWVSIFNPDSTQDRYYVLESGSLGERLNTFWYLAKVNQGTVRVNIQPGETRQLFISLRQAERAPGQAKWLAAGCVGAPFLLGALVGVLIALLAHG